jgi:hypothetical protein
VTHPSEKSRKDKELLNIRLEYDIVHSRHLNCEQMIIDYTRQRNEFYANWLTTPIGKAYQDSIRRVSHALFELVNTQHDPSADIQRAHWFFTNIGSLTTDFFANFHVDQERDINGYLQFYIHYNKQLGLLYEKMKEFHEKKITIIKTMNEMIAYHTKEKEMNPLLPPAKALSKEECDGFKANIQSFLKESSQRIITCRCGYSYSHFPWIVKDDIHGQIKDNGKVSYSCSSASSTNKRRRH